MADATRAMSPAPAPAGQRRFVRAPRHLAAGSCLVAVAVFALWAGAGLDVGRLRAMGPGMLPRSVAVLVLVFGLALAVASLLRDGEALGRWSLRPPLFVTLGVVAFALTIRTAGLALAGPLVFVIGGFASPEGRLKELVLFGVVVTALCIALFRYALGLPMPVLIIPGVVRI